MENESKEQPAGQGDIQPRPSHPIAVPDKLAPGRQDLGQREGNQDRDDDRIELEIRNGLASDPSCLTDRASAATDRADRQRHDTEVPTPECYRIQERPAVCCQRQGFVGWQAPWRLPTAR